MYNYTDLEAMDDSQLREVAESNGIKKINLDDKENLVYEILDKQARDVAAATSSVTNGRGRKNKKEAKDENAAAPQKQKKNSAEAAAAQAEQPAEQPKRRGRKPKNQTAEPAENAETAVEAKAEMPAAPAVESAAEPVAADPQQAQGEQQPKRRRGRPPRNPQPEAEANATENQDATSDNKAEAAGSEIIADNSDRMLPAPSEQPENEAKAQESATNNVPEAAPTQEERPSHGVFIRPGKALDEAEEGMTQPDNGMHPKRDFRPKDSSFGSFFPVQEAALLPPFSAGKGSETYTRSPASARRSNRTRRAGNGKTAAGARKTRRTATRTSSLNSGRSRCRPITSTALSKPQAYSKSCPRATASSAQATTTISLRPTMYS